MNNDHPSDSKIAVVVDKWSLSYAIIKIGMRLVISSSVTVHSNPVITKMLGTSKFTSL